MARLGVAPHVIERLLNHTDGTICGVGAVYSRHSYLPEIRAAADLWASHLIVQTDAAPVTGRSD